MEAKHLYKTARISNSLHPDWLPTGFKQGDIVGVKWHCLALDKTNTARNIFKVTAITGEVSWLYEMALCDFVL
jgi:hypothetical protein